MPAAGSSGSAAPSRLVSWTVALIARLLHPANRDYLVGDLLETWERACRVDGRGRANLALLRSALGSALMEEGDRWRGVLLRAEGRLPIWSLGLILACSLLLLPGLRGQGGGLHPIVREAAATLDGRSLEAGVLLQRQASLRSSTILGGLEVVYGRSALLARLEPEVILGRSATDTAEDGRREAVVTEAFWIERLGRSPDLPTDWMVDSHPVRVVGVVRIADLAAWGVEGTEAWVAADGCEPARRAGLLPQLPEIASCRSD